MGLKAKRKLKLLLERLAYVCVTTDDTPRVNHRVSEIINGHYSAREHKKHRKRRKNAREYYRNCKASCEAVKRGLDGFASSYPYLNERDRESHDAAARGLVISAFSHPKVVGKLLEYYGEKKENPPDHIPVFHQLT